MQILRKNPKLGNYLHYNHNAEAYGTGYERLLVGYEQVITGYEQVQIGYEQIQVGSDENGPIYADGDPVFANGAPIYGDDSERPIYEDGAELFGADWDEAWGEPPTDEDLAAWDEPEPDPPAPVTDVEIMTPLFIDRRRQAAVYLDGLKGQVWSYLKNEKQIDPDTVTANGVAFCRSDIGIGVEYDDFVRAGGHPDAALILWTKIQAIKGDFAWYDAGVDAIFAAGLGQS